MKSTPIVSRPLLWGFLLAGSLALAPATQAELLLSDDLDAPAGLIADVTSGSTAWDSGWVSQQGANPDFTISETRPFLNYTDDSNDFLAASGNYASWNEDFQSIGRGIDQNDASLDAVVDGGLVGSEPDATLYVSYLVRLGDDEGTFVLAGPGQSTWSPDNPKVIVQAGDSDTWELRVVDDTTVDRVGLGQDDLNILVDDTGIPTTFGETYLMVLRIDFSTDTNTVNLYVNPADLGTEPGTPSATLDSTDDLTFSRIQSQPRGLSDYDEFRFGTTFASVTPVQVSDPLAFDTPSPLPNGGVQLPYSERVETTGGVPGATYAVTSGSLPPGLSINEPLIEGTPTSAGTFNFTLEATDPAGTTATQAYSITIEELPVDIATSELPGGLFNSYYYTELEPVPGTAPFTWTIESGSLPLGLSLSGDGAISGVINSGGTASFTVKVTDSATPPTEATADLTITTGAAAADELLVYDPFDGTVETTPEPDGSGDTTLDGQTTGAIGFAAPWDVQGNEPTYNVFDTGLGNGPLNVGDLETTSRFGIGGGSFRAAKRNTDVAGALSDFLESVPNENDQVGADGTEIWFSALIRAEEDDDLDEMVGVRRPGGSGALGTRTWTVFRDGSGVLGLQLFNDSAREFLSDVSADVAQTRLVVVRMYFGDESTGVPNSLSLFIDPPSLGGLPPSEADIDVTVPSSEAFRFEAIGWRPGTGARQGSLDEIRLGRTFASVTPTSDATATSGFDDYIAGLPGDPLTGADAEPDADGDGDDVTNAAEYIGGSLANDATSVPLVQYVEVVDGGTFPGIEFDRIKSSVDPDASAEGTSGTDLTASPALETANAVLVPSLTVDPSPVGSDYERVTYRSTTTIGSAPEQFLNVVYSLTLP